MPLARIRQLPTRWVVVAAVVAWLVSGATMLHFGASWHLDLRVYRAAGHALYHGGSPFTVDFTANRLPFTYPPFALLILSPLSFGPLGAIEAVWWLASAIALVFTLAIVLKSVGCTSGSSIDNRRNMSSGRAVAISATLGGI